MSVNSKMTAIADAIRNLLDISGTMGMDAMASNISSITKRGSVAGTISTKAEQYIIPAGYHNGNGTVGIADAEQAKIIAENIKSGVTILGVAGSASGEIFSIIAVTYPAGSTCTCSDGTITLTARDTSGKALFNVPSAGTWTVTAVNGNQTASTTVTVSENESYAVYLSFGLVLFKNGTLETITGFDKTDSGGGEYTSYSIGDTLQFNIDPYSGGTVYGKFTAFPAVDMSGYSRLDIDLQYKNTPADSSGNKVTLLVGTSEKAHSIVNDTVRKTVSIDISAITGNISVGFDIVTNSRTVGNTLTVWSIVAYK